MVSVLVDRPAPVIVAPTASAAPDAPMANVAPVVPKAVAAPMEIAHFPHEAKVPTATARQRNEDPPARRSRRHSSA
jgi:hypothetical protein